MPAEAGASTGEASFGRKRAATILSVGHMMTKDGPRPTVRHTKGGTKSAVSQHSKRPNKQAGPRDPTPRELLAQQVRSGQYSPLGDMDPIEVPSPKYLAGMFPETPVDQRERQYVGIQQEYRAKLLLKRLQTPLGLAQWFATLGGRGIKAFRPFTTRKPSNRINWDRADGWLFDNMVNTQITNDPSIKRDGAIAMVIEMLKRADPHKWWQDQESLRQQYYRLRPDGAYQKRRKSKRAKGVASEN